MRKKIGFAMSVMALAMLLPSCGEEDDFILGGEEDTEYCYMLPYEELVRDVASEGGVVEFICNDGAVSRFWLATSIDLFEVLGDVSGIEGLNPYGFYDVSLEIGVPSVIMYSNTIMWSLERLNEGDIMADWIFLKNLEITRCLRDMGVDVINTDGEKVEYSPMIPDRDYGTEKPKYSFRFMEWAKVEIDSSGKSRRISIAVAPNDTGVPRTMCLVFNGFRGHVGCRPIMELNNMVMITQSAD